MFPPFRHQTCEVSKTSQAFTCRFSRGRVGTRKIGFSSLLSPFFGKSS
ncbi:Uncharacterized protein dnm_084210 [Desulfonema magnum]|uniref:Uncharacterized protein n=1 Tax=Desulfonema magnum TaxID=45655 RepID=A0A975BW29_9BACT|nr:Uncharacterized protein dnm_084210 [Desulfonema magnum]